MLSFKLSLKSCILVLRVILLYDFHLCMPNGKNPLKVRCKHKQNLPLPLQQVAGDLADLMMVKAAFFSTVHFFFCFNTCAHSYLSDNQIYTNAHKLGRIQAGVQACLCSNTHKRYPFPLETLTHTQHQSMACLHRSISFASGCGLHVCLPYHTEPLEQRATSLAYTTFYKIAHSMCAFFHQKIPNKSFCFFSFFFSNRILQSNRKQLSLLKRRALCGTQVSLGCTLDSWCQIFYFDVGGSALLLQTTVWPNTAGDVFIRSGLCRSSAPQLHLITWAIKHSYMFAIELK